MSSFPETYNVIRALPSYLDNFYGKDGIRVEWPYNLLSKSSHIFRIKKVLFIIAPVEQAKIGKYGQLIL